MNEVTFLILKIIVSVSIALITTFLIPFIRSQTKTKQQEELLKIVQVAVQAAEQTLTGGEVKKEDVLKFMTDWLAKRGIHISDEQLDKLIESAVFAMNASLKPVEVDSSDKEQ